MDWLLPYAPLLDLINVVATATIAVVAFVYSQKATRMNFIMHSTSMLNAVNSEFLASDDNLMALANLRQSPSSDVRRDYLMLNNLNYLHAVWSLRKEHAISPQMADAKLDNGAAFWVSASEPYLKDMLDRGFPDTFQREMMTRIAAQKAKKSPLTSRTS